MVIKKNYFFHLLVFSTIFFGSPLNGMRVKKIDLGATIILHCVEALEDGYVDITVQKMGEGPNACYSGQELHFENNGNSNEVILEGEKALSRWKELECNVEA